MRYRKLASQCSQLTLKLHLHQWEQEVLRIEKAPDEPVKCLQGLLGKVCSAQPEPASDQQRRQDAMHGQDNPRPKSCARGPKCPHQRAGIVQEERGSCRKGYLACPISSSKGVDATLEVTLHVRQVLRDSNDYCVDGAETSHHSGRIAPRKWNLQHSTRCIVDAE